MEKEMDINQKAGNIKDSKNPQDVVGMDPSEWQFDDDTIMALSDLGDVLRRIHNRMENEGYEIVDGKVKKREYATF
jgi:hypothetical protein